MERTIARLVVGVAAAIACGLACAGTGHAATTDASAGNTVTYAGTARVQVATWGQCGAGAQKVQLTDKTVTVPVAGVGTGTNRVEFVLGSPQPSGEGTFVVATADGSGGRHFWSTRYDDATGKVAGAINPDAIGASPLYTIIRTQQPYTPCNLAAGTAEATQSVSNARLAGTIGAGAAALQVKGTTSGGRTSFLVTTTDLHPASPDRFST